MEKWKDKVAIITGASSGIGAAVARRLVAEGMIVAGAARRMDRLQELKSQLPTGRFELFKCDVASEADIVQLFNDVDKTFGRVDVLINNAGVAHYTSLLEPSADALHALFDVNVIGPCLCTREFLRIMRQHQNDTGYILFTNSITGHKMMPSIPYHTYASTKHALKAIAEGLRQELRASGSRIRVGEVSPGFVSTEISVSVDKFGLSPDESKTVDAYRSRARASAESMQPEDVAGAFAYMLSAPERADVNEVIIHHMGSSCQ